MASQMVSDSSRPRARWRWPVPAAVRHGEAVRSVTSGTAGRRRPWRWPVFFLSPARVHSGSAVPIFHLSASAQGSPLPEVRRK